MLSSKIEERELNNQTNKKAVLKVILLWTVLKVNLKIVL